MSAPPRFGDVETRASAPRGFAASLLLLLITGILLVRHDLRPSTRAMIAGSHALLGLATATYGLRSLLRLFRLRVREFPVGWMLVLLTGVLTLSFGAARAWAPVVALHALVATTYGTSQLVPRRLAYLGAPLLGLFLTSVSWDLTTEKRPTVEVLPPVGPIDPDQNGGFASVASLPERDAARFTDPSRCNTCHLKISPSHAASAHRHASVTNPYYLHAARDLLDKRGPEAVTLCAGCHDLGLLAHRQLEEGLRGGPERAAAMAPGADVGVPCLACHGATRVRSQRGDGALALALPDDPIVRADGVRHTLSFWMTYVDPRSHREAMVPPDGRSSTRCGACHQASLHEGINGQAHTRGQVDRDVHRASVYFPGAGASGRLPLDRGPRSCADCHIATPATGHRMAAANTALAALSDDEEQLEAIERFLSEGARIGDPPPVALGVVWLDNDRFELGPQFTATEAGDVDIHVVVSNEGVGHLFPGGTVDTTQLWLEVEVVDAAGAAVAVSWPEGGPSQAPVDEGSVDLDASPPSIDPGAPFPDGVRDGAAAFGDAGARAPDGGSVVASSPASLDVQGPAADVAPLVEGVHRLGRVVVDAKGNDVVAHLTTELHTPLLDVALAPGHADVGRYRWRVPKPGTFRVRARLMHRKFAAAFSRLVGADPQKVPTLTVATERDALEPETLLARYIDATAAQWDEARARRAAAAGAERYTQHLEVRLARARFALERQRDPEAAARVLGDAQDPRAQFLRAQAHLLGGRPQETTALAQSLLEEFPEDPELLRLDATAHRRLGELEPALGRLLALLARRPDDFDALQTLVAVASELGDLETVAQWRPAAERVRPAREATAAANAREGRDPTAAAEATRQHLHRLVSPPSD